MRHATRDLTISSDIELGSAQEWSVADYQRLIHTGALSGSAPLTKNGLGTLILKSAGSLSGAITVEEGTLKLQGGGLSQGAVGGSGMLTVNAGATVRNLTNHAFGGSENPSRDLTLNGGRFILRKLTHFNDIFMTAGTILNEFGYMSEIRTSTGGGSEIIVHAADKQVSNH